MAKKKVSTEKPTGRKPGRQKRVVTPEMVERIGELWLTGHSLRVIGGILNIHYKTVEYHLDRTVKPLWEQGINRRKAFELARIDQIERIAWRKFRQSGRPQTKHSVKKQLRCAGADSKLAAKAGKAAEKAMEKLAVVEKTRETSTRPGEACWLAVVQWAVEQRCKIEGYYAPKKHQFEASGELRVAGMDRAELDRVMMERLMQRIEERRQYQSSLAMMNLN